MELQEDVELSIEFDYRSMAHEMGEAWNAIYIDGHGMARFVNSGILKNIKFRKEIKDGEHTVDADVNLKIDSTSEVWEVTNFLEIFGKTHSDLFAENMEGKFPDLSSFSFVNKKDFVIEVLVSSDNEYHAFAEGTSSGTSVIKSMNDWTIMCQGGYDKNVKCAILGMVPRENFHTSWYPFFIPEMRLDVIDVPPHVATFYNLEFPPTVFFQTSRESIENIVDFNHKWKTLSEENTNNEVRVDMAVSEQTSIRPGTCLRFRQELDNVILFVLNEMYRGKSLLSMMCITPNGLVLQMLDLGPVPVVDIIKIIERLVIDNIGVRGTFGAERMEITSVGISNYGQTYDIHLKPRIVNRDDGFKFIEIFSFILIRENELTIRIDNRRAESITGRGEEMILDAESTFEISTESYIPAIEYTDIKIQSSHFLMKGLFLAGTFIPEEFERRDDDLFYKTVYESMKMFILDNLRLDRVQVTSRKLT